MRLVIPLSSKMSAYYPPAADGRVQSFARNGDGHSAGVAIECTERSRIFPAVSDIISVTAVPGAVSETEIRKALVEADDLLLDDASGECASAIVLWTEDGTIRGVGAGGCVSWVFSPEECDAVELTGDIPRKPMLGEGIVALRTTPHTLRPGEVVVAGGHSLRQALDESLVRQIVRSHMAAGQVDRIPAALAQAAWKAGERVAILCYSVPVAEGLPNPWRAA